MAVKKAVYYILKTKFPTENTNIEGAKVPEMIAFIIAIKNRNLGMNILKYLSKKKDFIFDVCGLVRLFVTVFLLTLL